MFKDSFFKKVEDKTNVNKETIMSLAARVQNSNMKDENVLRELIEDVSKVAGKEVSKEQTDRIINTIIKDKVPKNLDKMI